MEMRTGHSAGHGKGSRRPGSTDPGAVSKYGVEAELTRRVARRQAMNDAACRIHTMFRDTGYYSEADDQVHRFGARRFAEYHFDSGPKGAEGVTVFVGPHASQVEKEWAKDTAARLAKRLGTKNRGVKVSDSLAVVREQYKDMASILVEIAFLSDYSDMHAYFENEAGVELDIMNARRKSIGRRELKFRPRLTWRKRRIPKYLKVV